MKRRHKMPFGAEYRDGVTRFRLWAPAARQVEVCLDCEGACKAFVLDRLGQGWFELVSDAAQPGTLYRFKINGAQEVPDPASRYQPQDVHGPSQVVDPDAFSWNDDAWQGRNWNEAVIYELHVGAFSPSGTFAAVQERLDYLADLGVTAIELMPVADFPGRRNWGYDGVLLFAPDSSYGSPEDLKDLVQAAHRRGIMMLLDVVYNHFGPEGNYLGLYAPQFFTDRHKTPWGNGINFDGDQHRVVRDFFIHNAMFWLDEYHFDGLRLDAVHAIVDDSSPDILTELADKVRHKATTGRQVHLILENDRNQARYLQRTTDCRPHAYDAQWNDDIHHCLHVLITGEKDGYYSDYADRPLDRLGRCLVEGFAYQGEKSRFRNNQERGESTRGLPPDAFVSFLQNHDQVGNRAFGERLTTITEPRAVRAAAEILFLAPSPPMLFMGEEFDSQAPFLFFCDFGKDLAAAVTAGRRNEFARFARFNDPEARKGIPDPNSEATFESSRLDWDVIQQPRQQQCLQFYRRLLEIRRRHIVPLLAAACAVKATYEPVGDHALKATWEFPDAKVSLLANLGSAGTAIESASSPVIYASESGGNELTRGTLSPWSVVWFLEL